MTPAAIPLIATEGQVPASPAPQNFIYKVPTCILKYKVSCVLRQKVVVLVGKFTASNVCLRDDFTNAYF